MFSMDKSSNNKLLHKKNLVKIFTQKIALSLIKDLFVP